MAGPEDEIAAGAGGRGYLRASHADREQVIETLKAAGRLVVPAARDRMSKRGNAGRQDRRQPRGS
jgi:hypothetical protein